MAPTNNYSGLSKQRKEILDCVKKLKKAAPNDIRSENPNIGNVHQQLERMLQDGFIKRVDERCYALTKRGEAIFEKKEPAKQSNISFTEAEIKLFEGLAKQDNWLDQLAQLLNPALLGLILERKACLLSLLSADDCFGDRNRIHVLLTGPPSVAKSSIIEWMHEFLWGYFMGPNAKKSGMEGTGKGYQYTPGKLQKADNSTLYVDELDKMPKREQETLLGAMEQGRISVDKDRVNRETYARVRVIGTSNSRERMIEQLLSRFDIQLEIKPLSKDERDKLILKRFNDWNRPKTQIEGDFSLKRYLLYAAQYPTKLPEDREFFALCTENELNWGQLQNKDIRQLESIPRLLIAISKLKLKPEPGEEELKEIIELLKKCSG